MMKYKSDRGNMTPYVIVLIFVFMMLMAGVWEYLRIYSVLAQVDQSVITAVEGVAQENWKEIYQGVREGYAGAFSREDLIKDWEEVINRKRITEQMKEMIDFEEDGLLLSKLDGEGKLIFSIKPDAMEISVINTEISDEEGNSLVVEAVNEVELPFMFLSGIFEDIPPITFERTTRCRYVPKF